ncbi:hypothetical protein LCGC14_1650890 [marine sediment metagenome]|uniref:Uncharacterized protein n=1 Tax=marine sediment metagenome TaxID=412755 RepID=A0A0F9IJC0_9ZZZZ
MFVLDYYAAIKHATETIVNFDERIARLESMISEDGPKKTKPRYLNFDSIIGLEPNQTVVLTEQPQIVFKAEFLFFPHSCSNFLIKHISVGKLYQFVSATGLYLDIIRLNNYKLPCDALQISQDVSIEITNLNEENVHFYCSLYGPAVD